MNRMISARNRATRHDIANLMTRVPEPTLSGPSPFLLIAHHGPQIFPPNNAGLPFTRHPHRGFETVTFVRAGSLAHEDSRTGARTVHAGGVQWMTAGSGVTHSETAPPGLRRDGGRVEILQLWLNLPSRLKGIDPDYIGLEGCDIPQVHADDMRVTVDVVSGAFDGQQGAIESMTGATILSVTLKPGGTVRLPAPSDRAVFLYLAEGSVVAGSEAVDACTRLEFESNGDEIALTASTDAFVIYGHAPWIHEPVAAGGPFVMTTHEELIQAARDYQAGRFD